MKSSLVNPAPTTCKQTATKKIATNLITAAAEKLKLKDFTPDYQKLLIYENGRFHYCQKITGIGTIHFRGKVGGESFYCLVEDYASKKLTDICHFKKN